MEIKWERNSRALALAIAGKIKDEDIIPRTQTYNFPKGMATVRMQRMNEKIPQITVHIRAHDRSRNQGHSTWTHAATLRVNMYPDLVSVPSGELDEGLTWLDVHNVVESVKATMGLIDPKWKR